MRARATQWWRLGKQLLGRLTEDSDAFKQRVPDPEQRRRWRTRTLGSYGAMLVFASLLAFASGEDSGGIWLAAGGLVFVILWQRRAR